MNFVEAKRPNHPGGMNLSVENGMKNKSASRRDASVGFAVRIINSLFLQAFFTDRRIPLGCDNMIMPRFLPRDASHTGYANVCPF